MAVSSALAIETTLAILPILVLRRLVVRIGIESPAWVVVVVAVVRIAWVVSVVLVVSVAWVVAVVLVVTLVGIVTLIVEGIAVVLVVSGRSDFVNQTRIGVLQKLHPHARDGSRQTGS